MPCVFYWYMVSDINKREIKYPKSPSNHSRLPLFLVLEFTGGKINYLWRIFLITLNKLKPAVTNYSTATLRMR